MKTNVVLSSKDRDLFGIVIKQESKTGFLSVSDLQQAYEIARYQYCWSERRVDNIMQTTDFKERIFYVLENQGFIKTSILGFMEMIENEGVTNVLKGLGVYKTTGRGSNKTTYTNPYIWILLAMELNPMIYAKVVIWLTDSLIFDRVDAGSEYKPMNSAIKSIVSDPEYRKYAIAINEKVFGHHVSGMRNMASASELKNITKIEQLVTQCINMNMIKTDEQIINAINNYKL